jgi:hypothetical protein
MFFAGDTNTLKKVKIVCYVRIMWRRHLCTCSLSALQVLLDGS